MIWIKRLCSSIYSSNDLFNSILLEYRTFYSFGISSGILLSIVLFEILSSNGFRCFRIMSCGNHHQIYGQMSTKGAQNVNYCN